MNEDRLARLEDAVAMLREEKAALVTSVEHLTRAVDKLNDSVDTLSAAMNRGKGALWVIVGASSIVGAVVTALILRLFEKSA